MMTTNIQSSSSSSRGSIRRRRFIGCIFVLVAVSFLHNNNHHNKNNNAGRILQEINANTATAATTSSTTTMIICPLQVESLLKCLNATRTIEPDACASCLKTAKERAGDRTKIQICKAWNTNYCTAVEVCRATCVGVHAIQECTTQFDDYKTCAPAQMSQSIPNNACPFDECQGAKSVSSSSAAAIGSSIRMMTMTTTTTRWIIASVGITSAMTLLVC